MSKRKSEGVKCWAVENRPKSGRDWEICAISNVSIGVVADAIFCVRRMAVEFVRFRKSFDHPFAYRIIPVLVTPIPPKKAKVRRGKAQ